MTSVTDLSSTMPHPTLTPITGTPTFADVQILKQETFANAASVESALTEPDLGHAMLVIGVPAYDTLVNAPVLRAHEAAVAAALAAGNVAPAAPALNHFVAPPRPTAQADLTGANSNQLIATRTAEWNTAVDNYKKYNGVKATLKKQILEAVPIQYISSLKDDTTGFSTVGPLELITHLTNMYGSVNRSDLDRNLTNLEAPWEPTDTMEGLWARCSKCEAIALAGNEPIQNAHKIRVMLKVLASSGVFSLDIREWNKRQPPLPTDWNAFKEFFAEANRERCANLTAGDYRHQAHAARAGATSPTFSELTPGTQGSTATFNPADITYCWTHGLNPHGQGHTSRTCRNKATGHQEDATIINMMGGNNTIRRINGEKNDFARLNPPRTANGQPRDRRRAQANSTTTTTTTPAPSTAPVATPAPANSNDLVNAVAQQVLTALTSAPRE
jgi:hypothetical protein